MNILGFDLNKKKAVIIASAAILATAGAGAAFALGGGSEQSVETSAASAVAVVKNEQIPVNTEPVDDKSVEIEGLLSFRKAGIEEYDMDFVAPETKLETKKKESVKPDTPNSFTVKLPADTSTILKPEKGAASYPGSRSIAGEYYTVYDEISGGNVTLNGHELICRIVNSEIGDSWGEEAIKAQAVAAYSYVRFNDECGYVPSVGLKAGYSAKLERCVTEVEGECVYYNGAIIDAVYSASSAGASAPSEKIWGAAHPYLKAVESAYDYKDPNYGVVKTFSKDSLKSIIEKNTGLKLSDDPRNWFEIESVFSGKYIDKMKLDGKQYISVGGTQRRVTGALMRSHILGVSNLKSTAFEISYDNGVFTFKTFGWGHGVGMSQWGACYYAKAGYTYDQILRHYYTGTTVGVSTVNNHAVERAQMTQEQLDQQAEEAKQKQEAETTETAETVTQTTEPETQEQETAAPAAETEQPAAETEQPAETTAPQEEPAAEETTASETEPEQTEQPEEYYEEEPVVDEVYPEEYDTQEYTAEQC